MEVSTPLGRLTWSSRPDHLPHNESLSAIAVTRLHQSVPGTSKCCSLMQHHISKAQGPNTMCATHLDLSPAPRVLKHSAVSQICPDELLVTRKTIRSRNGYQNRGGSEHRALHPFASPFPWSRLLWHRIFELLNVCRA